MASGFCRVHVKDIKKGDEINIQLKDGNILTKVTKVSE